MENSTDFAVQGKRRKKHMERNKLKEYENGKAFDAYFYYGAHPLEEGEGYRFCVYAPRAKKVELIGEFTGWQGQPMEYQMGNWSAVNQDALPGMLYKFRIYQQDGRVLDKAESICFQHGDKTRHGLPTDRDSFVSFSGRRVDGFSG